ncbi:hypothetical protein MNV49_002914 [Pseudohyphozyma bogoriensis]|nr:hypothetical protein MNV49_002914 [Pseudohyphozyma bogoriensis]
MSSASASTSALRPVTVPRLPAAYSEVNQLKQVLAALEADVEGYRKLEDKLANITDEPQWNAQIPFGPLAYFHGRLVHTNDILVPLPAPLPSTSTTSTQSNKAEAAPPTLRSAKQAREAAAKAREQVEKRVVELKKEIETKEKLESSSKSVYPGLEDGWAVNENGEILNEEGLPMFDIQEELPPEPTPAPAPAPTKTPETKTEAPKMRYLIKKGGKQIVRPLNVPATPTSTSNSTAPAPAPIVPAAQPPSSAAAAPSQPAFDTKAFLDELEKEEEEENERLRLAREAEETEKGPEERIVELESPTTPPAATSTTPPKPTPSTSATPTPNPPTKEFLSSFGKGFLSKSKPAAKPSPQPPTPAQAPLAPSSPLPAKSTPPSSPPKSHEPLHHVLPTPKSIYRPTPPPSEPPSRPSSPRPDRKVVFDVPESEPKPPKQKRAPIILGPPPSTEQSQASSSASTLNDNDTPRPPSGPKAPTQRPIKEQVVERPIKAPSAPKARQGAPLPVNDPAATFGRGPKAKDAVGGVVERESKPKDPVGGVVERQPAPPVPPSQPQATPIATPGNAVSQGPIHTLSLGSSSKPLTPGSASIHEITGSDVEEDAGHNPSLTSDGDSDSDSSGFYGNEDLSDESDVDIDAVLHAREVALEYHRQRMNVGAGAGTGPLGGDGLPEGFDTWNQPNVPIEATVQGRVPGTSRQSRFRTGRLESAQMIIPSLLASQVRQDRGRASDSEGEDEDGLSPEERESIRTALEKLSAARDLEGAAATGTRIGGNQSVGSISQMLGGTTATGAPPKAPPVVRTVGVPISVPSGPQGLAATVGGENASASSAPASAAAPPADPPKKMSRFKARQLGLE